MKENNIEEVILGSLISNWQEHINVFGILKPEHFYESKNSTVYRAINNLNQKGLPIDIVTVCNELKILGLLEACGGTYEISTLMSKAVYSNLERHSYIVVESFLKRQIELLALTIQNKIKEPVTDVFELIGETEKILSDLLNGISIGKIQSIEEIKNEVLDEMREVVLSGKKSGVTCSIDAINNHTSGWQKGNLIILAGRPGMGKTSAALDFALEPAMNGKATAFFSLEMPIKELVGRAMSMKSAFNVQNLINKNVNNEDVRYLTKESEIFNRVPLYIDETPQLTLHDFRNKVRKLKREKGIELIIIDYLQLMRVSSKQKPGNREQEISEISRGLKAIAKELDLPIIALAQLSRQPEMRPDKKPIISDLRESGAIEQDADLIIFLFRPEYYAFETYTHGNQEIPAKGLLMFIFAKFRNGAVGEIKSRFIGSNTLILNYSHSETHQNSMAELESNSTFLTDKL